MQISEEEFERLNFYNTTYEAIGVWHMKKGERQYLGDPSVRVCRFCGKSKPEMKFKKLAHVVPQSLGNRNLLSYYECDVCNETFGGGIENDLGNWTKPFRTMLRIDNGNSGIPTLKGTGASPWRIEGKDGSLAIHAHRNDMPHSEDEDKQSITFDLPRDVYTPVAVMKAFVRIGLTLMPDEELIHFDDLMDWIKNPDHRVRTIGSNTIYQTMHPGPQPNDQLLASLLRRVDDDASVPYMFLILCMTNQAFQVPLTSRERDAHLQGRQITLPILPTFTVVDRSIYGEPVGRSVDLSRTTQVRDDRQRIVMRYEAKQDMQGHRSGPD